jgi:hypothetical protein
MGAGASTVERGDVTLDTPLRLADAARISFPGGGVTAASLRRERDAGRLDVWLIAGKEFTSLAAIEVMKQKCLNLRKVRASGSSRATPLHRKHRARRVGHPRREIQAEHWLLSRRH